MRAVELKEIIHGLYFSGYKFTDANEACEWLCENFFTSDEHFTMEQIADAMLILYNIGQSSNVREAINSYV